MSNKLSREQIKELEVKLGEPVRFLEYPGIGTIVFKQASENAWNSFERGKRQYVLGKGDLNAAIKNLVFDCLVHPSPVEFDAAVKSAKRWKAWEHIGDKIVEWAGSGEEAPVTESLGND